MIRNIDIREITKVNIPPYENKFYFDFIIMVREITTDGYWFNNLWTQKVCSDLRYYMSRERKYQYQKIGISLAKKYNETLVLGHVNLNTGKLKSSAGIERLVSNGWIPSISLLPQPYGEMIRVIESTNDIDQVNEKALGLFNHNLIDEIFERWKYSSLLRGREYILSTALERYKNDDYVSSVHILLPQIEGLITKHIKRKNEIPERDIDKRFKQFGNIINSEKYNSEMTRYLCKWLIKYLKSVFYKTWYPFPQRRRYPLLSNVPQRHVILHGETKPKYFTAANTLKLICIIDSIILLSLIHSELKPGKRIN